MAWFLIVMLTVVVLGALLAVLVLAACLAEGTEDERLRIDMEVRSAERRLHDIASNTFRTMLDEARAHDHSRVK